MTLLWNGWKRTHKYFEENIMTDFKINEMQEMQRSLQDKYEKNMKRW